MRLPIPVYFACIFFAMLFYGVVSLLPPRTKHRKKAKPRSKIEPILAIIIGLSGLGLLAWTFIWRDVTAKVIFNVFVLAWFAIGAVVWLVSFIVRMKKRKNEKE